MNVVFYILAGLTDITGLPVSNKSQTFMSYFFGGPEYQAVAYGSSTNDSNKQLSDVS
jgi:hypothetical protein